MQHFFDLRRLKGMRPTELSPEDMASWKEPSEFVNLEVALAHSQQAAKRIRQIRELFRS